MTNTLRTGKWYIWFVDLPIKDGDVPVRNVSLPRVNPIINHPQNHHKRVVWVVYII